MDIWTATNVIGRYQCVCYGHIVHDEPPGSCSICPVCRWEDDRVQLGWPARRGGANRSSLIAAQQNYAMYGASELKRIRFCRPPREDEPIVEGFRVIDLVVDRFLDDSNPRLPADMTKLYWWRGES